MSATPEDYAWIDEPEFSGWIGNGYCVAVLNDMTVEQTVAALRAAPVGTVRGLEELAEPSFDAWDVHAGDVQVVGLRQVGDAVLMLEVNGFVGVTDPLMRPLSRGRQIVAHFKNVNALDRFTQWRDGEVLLDMEAVTGAEFVTPSPRLRAQIIDCGIPIAENKDENEGEDEDDLEERDWARQGWGVFALLERLTGVRITADTLRGDLILAEVNTSR